MDCSVELYQSFIDVPCWLRHVLIWTYFQQTLLAGAGALLAAWLTIRSIRKQNKQTKKHRKNDLVRKKRMVNAGLPIAASELITYAENSLKYLMGLYESHLNKMLSIASPTELTKNPPDYPISAMLELQKMIEWADIEDAKTLAEVIAFTQVQHARMKSLKGYLSDPDFLLTNSNYHGPIMDTLGVYKRAEMVFPYARGKDKFIRRICDSGDAINTLQFGNGFVLDNSELTEYIQQNWPPELGWG